MHLVALYAMGRSGVLIVQGYRFSFLPLTVDSFHTQPSAPLDLSSHLVFDFAGPALALLLLGALAWVVRGRLASAMLLANLAILGFYAVIEPLDVLLDAAGRSAPFLLWAEFDYGVPLVVLLLAAIGVSRRAPA
ncbi:MAG TPA: hypothetical protein VNG93_11665 [Candidatus Dormibacteraeota bacterium]|nr:hypothetical protein [Candidatus Dormibacteraeota bacterium]